jgi:drug/metabolite transporter (DMT)-like permease
MTELTNAPLNGTAAPDHSWQADLWLTGICIIWGASFPLVKIAIQDITPFLFLSVRFFFGGLLLFPFLKNRGAVFTWNRIYRGGVLGLFMFAGMLFQTLGLQYTTASNSGFITGLAVVIVPFLVVIIERRWPKWPVWLGVVLALTGLYFLTQPEVHGINRGDIYTIICAVSFSFEIVYIEIFIKENESLPIALIMIWMTSLLSFLSMLIFETPRVIMSWPMLASLGYVSLFCTALGFAVQTTWQPRTTATAASVIYSAEPVFAALFAGLLLNEHLPVNGYLGGGFILAGMLIAELRRML